jgi:hypothetical protein
MFSASKSLGDVSMWGIQWTCTCSELWFIPYTIENNITLHGDILCSAPAEHASKCCLIVCMHKNKSVHNGNDTRRLEARNTYPSPLKTLKGYLSRDVCCYDFQKSGLFCSLTIGRLRISRYVFNIQLHSCKSTLNLSKTDENVQTWP